MQHIKQYLSPRLFEKWIVDLFSRLFSKRRRQVAGRPRADERIFNYLEYRRRKKLQLKK